MPDLLLDCTKLGKPLRALLYHVVQVALRLLEGYPFLGRLLGLLLFLGPGRRQLLLDGGVLLLQAGLEGSQLLVRLAEPPLALHKLLGPGVGAVHGLQLFLDALSGKV